MYLFFIWIRMFGVVCSFRIDAPLNAQHDVHSDRSIINEQAVVAEVFEKSARAQWFKDVYLYNNYFYGVEKGIVVESGAFDGLTFSTTFAFQKLLNWTAVHIEGSPRNYDKLVKNRPDSINCHVALCSIPGSRHFISNNFKFGGNVDGIMEYMSDKYIRFYHHSPRFTSWKDVEGRYTYTGLNTSISTVSLVECTRFSSLLNFLHIKKIDLWVLDVEGGELSALHGTDFTRAHISVILIETMHDDSSIHFLQEHGYKCKLVKNNNICSHPHFKPSKNPVAKYGS